MLRDDEAESTDNVYPIPTALMAAHLENEQFHTLKQLGASYKYVMRDPGVSLEERRRVYSEFIEYCYLVGCELFNNDDSWNRFMNQPSIATNRVNATAQGAMGAVVVYALGIRSVGRHPHARSIARALSKSYREELAPEAAVLCVERILREDFAFMNTMRL
jgi:hypothetical protein